MRMRMLSLTVGLLMGLTLGALAADAQPAYTCRDAAGHLVLTQGDPPPGLKCSEAPGLRADPSQRSGIDWEQKARESRAETEGMLRESEAARAQRQWAERAARDAQAREQYQQNLDSERASAAESSQKKFGSAVEACKRYVRGKAFTSGSTVTTLATDRALYEFDKCMAEAGHPVTGR